MPILDVANPLSFFKGMNGTFADVIMVERDKDDFLEKLLPKAFTTFDLSVDACAQGMGALACRGGCASCCTIRVAATAPEILHIARHLRALSETQDKATWTQDLLQRLHEANDTTHGLGEQDRMEQGVVCPFIEEGLCVIYAQRPLACRGHASFSEKACVEALNGEEIAVPVSSLHLTVRSLIQNSLQSALRDADLGWGIYELNQALEIALKQPDIEAEWLAGKDVFASAMIMDVSPDEMAETFEAIKAMAA
ncbi:YkgJ family cysteine cluster protein [Beijerinckia indica]|uniref:Uncharacterized protein n=1 Tax=Beijerinckia indica subsp. indica (strain ATCC 9039 / DSM 1715 / NCIMB 8712) TaxID=395963 RepID=B2IDH2_BEII9|nr:YkgJ family cysteine cluster protein [Beijerinckia indica]ACB95408.1 protein of unknown function UPF0153 [Beijerinckia indica subsp. indica ATCC 9039]